MVNKDKIREILSNSITIHYLEITDDSDKHAGHAEAVRSGGGHYSALIVSNDFNGKKPVDRHRMVMTILREHFEDGIHAFALRTFTPDEYGLLNSD